MKNLIAFFLFFVVQRSIAQRSIEGLIRAEKSFAAYSVDHGTKEAFLHFLDSSGIVFEKGQPVNGIVTWTAREKRPGVLNWYPRFAEVSASDDFGYTTGPWTFQPKTITDTVVASGWFVTVWHIDDHGAWKALADLGVGNSNPAQTGSLAEDSAIWTAVIREEKVKKASRASLMKAEEDFIKKAVGVTNGGAVKAYRKSLSANSILDRNDLKPAKDQEERNKVLAGLPEGIQYTTGGSGLAPSGDLGYVYGTMLIHGKTDNYLRIWRREGKVWKIALEVLRY
jgi:hypothetical protein